jgi:hypothetical protein
MADGWETCAIKDVEKTNTPTSARTGVIVRSFAQTVVYVEATGPYGPYILDGPDFVTYETPYRQRSEEGSFPKKPILKSEYTVASLAGAYTERLERSGWTKVDAGWHRAARYTACPADSRPTARQEIATFLHTPYDPPGVHDAWAQIRAKDRFTARMVLVLLVGLLIVLLWVAVSR